MATSLICGRSYMTEKDRSLYSCPTHEVQFSGKMGEFIKGLLTLYTSPSRDKTNYTCTNFSSFWEGVHEIGVMFQSLPERGKTHIVRIVEQFSPQLASRLLNVFSNTPCSCEFISTALTELKKKLS